jgi:hypothetical protein
MANDWLFSALIWDMSCTPKEDSKKKKGNSDPRTLSKEEMGFCKGYLTSLSSLDLAKQSHKYLLS